MAVSHDKWCWNIDKRSQGSDGASMSLNPMGEFAMLHHEKDPVDEDFHDFRKKHNRVYKDKIEHQKRKHIFRHNLRFATLSTVINLANYRGHRQSEPIKTHRRYV